VEGNILIDDNHNVWLIDFADTGRGHVLKDVTKLECEVLYMTTLEDEEDLREGIAITKVLLGVRDLAEDLPEVLDGLSNPDLVRAYHIIRFLRQQARKIVKSCRETLQINIPLLRYSLHAMCFEHLPKLQRIWALAAACGYAQRILDTVQRREGPIRVRWTTFSQGKGRLGTTIIPGRAWRDQGTDVATLKELGVKGLLCLCTTDELHSAGTSNLARTLQDHGLQYMHCPLFVGSHPSLEQARELVHWLACFIHAGNDVAVASWSGLGRCGTITACCLVEWKGSGAEEALKRVRITRENPRAIENERQADFVHAYHQKFGCSDDNLSRKWL